MHSPHLDPPISDEYQKKGFVLKMAAEKAMEK
jgi:hypothetical protein